MRKFPGFIVIVMLAALLAACGSTESAAPTSGSGQSGSTDAGQPTTAATETGSSNGAGPDTTLNAEIKGSGASFPAKVYQQWIEDYKQVVPGVTINYQSVGSGQGINDFTSGITAFGATDAFLTDEEQAKVPDALHIPMVSGAVVATYNLPDVQNLRFSPETLADIFLGKITTWNDPKIAADNPDVTLPDTPITVVYRADGSGTNSIFTTYLSAVSPEFKEKVGAGKTVPWPVGQGEQKNDGVAKAVKNMEGAIGYVELIYALGNNLPAPAIKNAAGEFVTPSLESVSAAAQGFVADMPADLRIDIVNPPEGANSYPISGFTWILVHENMQDQAKAKALVDFLAWALFNGDEQAKALGYAPLPAEVKQLAVQKLGQVKVNGTPVYTPPAGQ